jgi:hypothetical protein
MVTLYVFIGIPGTECLLYINPSGFQGLNGYYICVLWNFKDRMVILYVVFGVLRFKWLLFMHLSEFQGLNVW